MGVVRLVLGLVSAWELEAKLKLALAPAPVTVVLVFAVALSPVLTLEAALESALESALGMMSELASSLSPLVRIPPIFTAALPLASLSLVLLGTIDAGETAKDRIEFEHPATIRPVD